MTPATVLVTGASGQLAHFIVAAFADWHVVALDRAALDIADPEALRRRVAEVGPRVIVNCAAFNDVDGAERRPREALAVNALAVRSLAQAAESAGARLVHFGTDFVFDGRATAPYDETSAPSPQSTYAASKLLGEWFALDSPGGLVLRVESLFGSPAGWTGRRGTLDGIVDNLRHGREVRALTDRVVSPGYTPDIAAATRHLIDVDAAPGLYHCVNSGHGTWEAVAREAARLLGVEPRITPITVDQLTLPAARPAYCAMATTKLAAAGFPMPAWDDALRRWLSSRADLLSEVNERSR